MNLNKVILSGRATADPETNEYGARFSIATNKKWTDKEGVKQERTEFHNIVVGGRLAEIVAEYIKKGTQVLVEGEIQTRNWEKDGQKRQSTVIQAQNIQF